MVALEAEASTMAASKSSKAVLMLQSSPVLIQQNRPQRQQEAPLEVTAREPPIYVLGAETGEPSCC